MNIKILNKHINSISKEDRLSLGISKKCKKTEIEDTILEKLLENETLDNALKLMASEMSDKSFNKLYKRIKPKFGLKDLPIPPYRFFNGTYSVCKECGNLTLNSVFCSIKCANKNDETKEKIKNSLNKTLNERYGGLKSTSQIPDSREKAKQTCLKKYGVLGQYSGDTEKRKQTCLEKYGSKTYNNAEQQRYTKYHQLGLTDEEIEDIIKNRNKDFCLENFLKNGYFDTEKFQEYFKCSYSYVSMLKKKMGINLENWTHFLSGHSKAELELFEWIPVDNKISGDRTLIAPYEIDILLPDFKLAIEYNGTYWHSMKPLEYHLHKYNLCLEQGYELWYIYDTDDIEFWKQRILDKLNGIQRKFDIAGIVDRRLYNMIELNKVLEIIDPSEGFILGSFRCS